MTRPHSNGGRRSSTARGSAPPVTSRPSSPSRGTICIRRARSASTRSRRTARRPTCTARRLWQVSGAHQKGGFFHDGRFATLLDVVNHYDGHFKLNLSDADKKDLVEYLKGI